MDAPNNAGQGTRRNEDIALDLMKFVAGVSGLGRPVTPSTGFSGTPASKPEENVEHLLDLYRRCLSVVAGGSSEAAQ